MKKTRRDAARDGYATRRGRNLDADEAREMSRRGIVRQRADKLLALYVEKPITFPKKELLGFEDAAKLLNWTRQSVYHAALKTRELPYVQHGERYYIRTSDLAKFVRRIIQDALEDLDREDRVETGSKNGS